MAKPRVPANVISTKPGPRQINIRNSAGNSLSVADYRRITGKPSKPASSRKKQGGGPLSAPY